MDVIWHSTNTNKHHISLFLGLAATWKQSHPHDRLYNESLKQKIDRPTLSNRPERTRREMRNLARDFKKGHILTFFSAEIKLKVSCYFSAFKSQQAHKERIIERHYAHNVKGKILREPMKDRHSAVIMHSRFSPLCVILRRLLERFRWR